MHWAPRTGLLLVLPGLIWGEHLLQMEAGLWEEAPKGQSSIPTTWKMEDNGKLPSDVQPFLQ